MKGLKRVLVACVFTFGLLSAQGVLAEVYFQAGGSWVDTRYSNGLNLNSKLGWTAGVGYRFYRWFSIESNFMQVERQTFSSDSIDRINHLVNQRTSSVFDNNDQSNVVHGMRRSLTAIETIALRFGWPVSDRALIYGRFGIGMQEESLTMDVGENQVKVDYHGGSSFFGYDESFQSYSLGASYDLSSRLVVKAEYALFDADHDIKTSSYNLKLAYRIGSFCMDC